MRRQPIFFSALFLSTLLLTACGQKGKLYLPGNPSEMRSEVPPQDPATAKPEDDENDDERSRQ